MGESYLVGIPQYGSVISFDSEGVDPIKGLEVAELGSEDVRGDFDIGVEVDVSNVFEALFARVSSSFSELDTIWSEM